MANGIVDKPISKRAAVHTCQAELLALLARELMHADSQSPHISLSDWWQLPEYQRFVLGAYAAGFVCTDLAPMKEFEAFCMRPRDHLYVAGFNKLRHWVHTLLRAERWADGYSSPIREAVVSGALEVVTERLESDDSLKHRAMISDET